MNVVARLSFSILVFVTFLPLLVLEGCGSSEPHTLVVRSNKPLRIVSHIPENFNLSEFSATIRVEGQDTFLYAPKSSSTIVRYKLNGDEPPQVIAQVQGLLKAKRFIGHQEPPGSRVVYVYANTNKTSDFLHSSALARLMPAKDTSRFFFDDLLENCSQEIRFKSPNSGQDTAICLKNQMLVPFGFTQTHTDENSVFFKLNAQDYAHREHSDSLIVGIWGKRETSTSPWKYRKIFVEDTFLVGEDRADTSSLNDRLPLVCFHPPNTLFVGTRYKQGKLRKIDLRKGASASYQTFSVTDLQEDFPRPAELETGPIGPNDRNLYYRPNSPDGPVLYRTHLYGATYFISRLTLPNNKVHVAQLPLGYRPISMENGVLYCWNKALYDAQGQIELPVLRFKASSRKFRPEPPFWQPTERNSNPDADSLQFAAFASGLLAASETPHVLLIPTEKICLGCVQKVSAYYAALLPEQRAKIKLLVQASNEAAFEQCLENWFEDKLPSQEVQSIRRVHYRGDVPNNILRYPILFSDSPETFRRVVFRPTERRSLAQLLGE